MDTDQQGTLYLTQLVNAVAAMRPAEFELEEAWNRVVREHKTTVWPTPAEICTALTEYRQKVARVQKQDWLASPVKRLPPADDGAYDPEAEAEALRTLDDMERDPRSAKLARTLRDMYDRKWGRLARRAA